MIETFREEKIRTDYEESRVLDALENDHDAFLHTGESVPGCPACEVEDEEDVPML